MTIAKILKSIEAHGGNPPYWFELHEDSYNNFENGSTIHLMDCEEIWELMTGFRWNQEDMAHTTQFSYFRKYRNPYCDKPENIWHMQLDLEQTDEYSQIFSSEKEAIDAINNNKIVWSKGDPSWEF